VIESLPSKCEALSSNPSTAKRKNNENLSQENKLMGVARVVERVGGGVRAVGGAALLTCLCLVL
jgi:hypothetical protein